MNEAQTGCQSRNSLIVVPQREGVMRNLRDLRASARRYGGAGDESILIGITAGDSPGSRDAAIQAKLVTVGALAARLHDSGGIVGIGRPRIGSVQAIGGGRKRQGAIDVPLDAQFVVAELFRLD